MAAARLIRRLFGIAAPRIPDALWQDSLRRLPFLQRLSADERARLKALSEKFLDTIRIAAAGGMELSDGILALIAAQACLPVLNLTLDLYDDLAALIVYPSAFIVPRSETDRAGVVHEWREPLAGEALDASGAVVLSWEDVEDGCAPDAGRNVVIHEFVHKIDMRRGGANGYPPFLAAYHGSMRPGLWQRAFSAAYADFCARLDALEHGLPPDFDPAHAAGARYDESMASLPLDAYAARAPAEFFAVASEVFFVRPQPLAAAYPEVYRLLSEYYRQAPLTAAQLRAEI